MFLNSVVSEGLAGMQQSHKKMQQAAEKIVKAGIPTDNSIQNVGNVGSAPITNNGTSVTDLPSTSAVSAAPQSDGTNSSLERQSGDIVEPLIEIKRQELMFDAAAAIVKTDMEMVGKFIDEIS